MSKTYKPIKHLSLKLKSGTIVTWSLLGLMLILFTYWNAIRDLSIGGIVAVWSLQSLPLLALLPGIYKKNYRSYSWLCFILLFYFIVAVERAMVSTSTWTDYIFVGLIVGLFISSMMTGRWLQRTQKQHLIDQQDIENDV